jgi:DNA-directed RNA polymerase subunit RPC12/RpoP
MARGKNISHHCNHCERITKMEMVGSAESQPDKTWYRCTRCRHASLIDVNSLKKLQEESKKTPEKVDCTEYRPNGTYTVGQAIFHSGWDDVGKIVSKERTSRGEHAIVVSFEKHGERRLLESVTENAE